MPITAPDQHVPDAASRPGSARDFTHYHRVAPVKFVVLSLCTLGLYEAYWFYRSWRFVQERDDRRILPFARAVFSPLWHYALVQDVNRAQVASGTAMAALGLALAYGVLAVAWRLPEPWWLISLATFVPLLPVVRRIDTINHALGVAPSRSRRFGLGHVSVCVVGGTFVLFSVLSALLVLPSSEVVAHGMTNNAQPTVVSGRVFMASDNCYIYSLDAKTGCVYWSFQQGSIVRNSPMVGAVSGQGSTRWAVFFGDGHANVFALDAETGRQLWKVRVDDHVVARITAGVKYSDGRLYVPVSGSEEFSSGHQDYPCCTARGAVVALDASTGRQIWKTYLADEPKPWKLSANGVQLYGPATGGVWATPTVDPVRGALYVGTGDAVTPPESPLTDAILALDLESGAVLWVHRTVEYDLFMGGCAGATRGEQCPNPMGPDFDIGNSPILVTLGNGRRAVLAGTKSADVIALDPDDRGAVLFKVNPVQPAAGAGRGGRGSIVWGGASDAERTYYGMGAAGLGAVQSADGTTAWVFTAPGVSGRGNAALGAAPTAIPGVVFQGAGDGRLFAVSAADGRALWEFNTAREFDTVNRVPARGGAIATSGAVVVDGMVYVGSGYAISSGASGGNVLLAFGTE